MRTARCRCGQASMTPTGVLLIISLAIGTSPTPLPDGGNAWTHGAGPAGRQRGKRPAFVNATFQRLVAEEPPGARPISPIRRPPRCKPAAWGHRLFSCLVKATSRCLTTTHVALERGANRRPIRRGEGWASSARPGGLGQRSSCACCSQRRRETLVAPLQRRVSLILVTRTQVQPVSLQTRSSLAPGGL